MKMKPVTTNYLALNYLEPGSYIPVHDPSFTNETYEKAVAEALVDVEGLKDETDLMAVYKLIAVVSKDKNVVEVI